MNTLFSIWNSIHRHLFPSLEEELDPLSEKEKHFVQVMSLLDLGPSLRAYSWQGIGRKRKSRLTILKAFVAKAVYNFETTDIMIEYLKGCKNLRRLCGWESPNTVPSKATFSRAFAEFSKGQLANKTHEIMLNNHYGDKLAGHVSRDSTAIEAREKAKKKPPKPKEEKQKARRGRPRKGELAAPKPPKRLDLQLNRSLEENVKDLPTFCDVGTKLDSKGHKMSWIGYKLHLDCIDGDIPVSAILTSASLHDSQAAIPLSQMSAARVNSLYELMDSAYDAPQIKSCIERRGHIAIIDHNPRRGEKIEMEPARKVRFRERSTAERVNSNLKDNHGGRNVRVRGAAKVMTHLMFGVIVITATQLYRLLL